MKHLFQILLSIAIVVVCISPLPAYASDDVKQTYQTAQLVPEIRIGKIDNRVIRLKNYLKYHASPMADSASSFVKEADRLGLDWKLVAAIAGNESYFGWYIPEDSYNGWGWAVWTGMSYGAAFQSWDEGIRTVSEGLKENYIDQGLTTVDQIGQKYAADPGWAWKVNHFMEEIERFDINAANKQDLALAL